MAPQDPLQQFTLQSFYVAHFMDASFWQPYVQRVCQQHGYHCIDLSPGLPGTYPTFIVEVEGKGNQPPPERLVLKFFGPLYEGASAFQVEQAMGKISSLRTLPIHVPDILAQGQLSKEWSYLILEHIPGQSVGQVRQLLSRHSWMELASQMGTFMRELHTSTSAAQFSLHAMGTAMSWEEFPAFIETQLQRCYANHQEWQDLPPHLLEQIPSFLPQLDDLVDRSEAPYLIHGDLTADHVLGRQSHHRWQTLAIIDWGDARLGNILYELVALHLDLFQGDVHLLHRCLDAYLLPAFYRQNFSRKAFSMVLLHQFPMPVQVYAPHREVASLDELAQRLFGTSIV